MQKVIECEAEESEDEFYSMTEHEAEEIDKSYAFMAMKFPNLIFRKNQPFREKGSGSLFKPWDKGKSSAKGFK